MRQPVLILGSSGQLAQALIAVCKARDVTFFALGRDQLDLNKLEDIAPALEKIKPACVINAAAYTAVDKAESEPESAIRLNSLAPAEIATVCDAMNARLIHVSTDYVFSGERKVPLVESDVTEPINVYGQSKLAGEKSVLDANKRALVVRTSWIVSDTPPNFAATMLRLAKDRDEISVVSDQVGRPTVAIDLAKSLLDLAADETMTGLLHIANSGVASWADLAEATMHEAERQGLPFARINRITTQDYPTPARRPQYTVLDTARFEDWNGAPLPHWREHLPTMVHQLSRTV